MHLYKIGETNYVNIINSRVEDSTWLMLRPGLNSFTYTTDTGDDNISISFIGNNMYGGV